MSGKIVAQILISQLEGDEVQVTIGEPTPNKVTLFGLLKFAEKIIDGMGPAKPAIVAPPMAPIRNLRGPTP